MSVEVRQDVQPRAVCPACGEQVYTYEQNGVVRLPSHRVMARYPAWCDRSDTPAEEAAMATVKVKGQDVRVGDDLWTSERPHRVTRIEPYRHPVVTRGEDWRIAYADGPAGTKPWGMTLTYDHGWAASYEITARPGEPPYVNQRPDDDYPSPFYGAGAALFPRYEAGGAGLSWREWVAAYAPGLKGAVLGQDILHVEGFAYRPGDETVNAPLIEHVRADHPDYWAAWDAGHTIGGIRDQHYIAHGLLSEEHEMKAALRKDRK